MKLSDPLLVDMLIQKEGYFRGYHISRGNWVSILLDGTVPFDEVCGMLDSPILPFYNKSIIILSKGFLLIY